ncbi:cytochrome c biogenesis protein ccsb, putative [Heliomicrobium modesticaldum Ice1]|uniref:Cytochrome c biogenesis protein ccsb, putative n=1 Tax=Heliobacterium modesticaldum (strain ATCC 51547 / Ice1) TaxID=498761 RepID=B0TFT9_HELMI|nr:cytochrome c biogenesis protein ResB [Heliomicrobium modesticaldum]ABZ84519.1 cytochrome c biogenesis protein ccsb, putative [Heliomicrobium modesticaldum Ice1]
MIQSQEEREDASGTNRGLVDRIWDIFSSMKLGLFLLLLIAVASIIGTVIPQNGDPRQYGSLYSLYSALGLIDMYHSSWFMILLFLLAMNLFICTFNRAPGIWRQFSRPSLPTGAESVGGLATERPEPVDELARHVSELWQRLGYRVFSESRDGKHYIYADKGRFGLWGSLLSHVGMLVILIGGVVGLYGGEEGRMPAEVGKTFRFADVPGLPKDENLEIQVNDFRTVFREDGTIADWFSNLTLLENGREIMTKEIQVNDPLEYRGYKVYQAFYGSHIVAKITSKNDPEGHAYTVEEGDVIPVAGTDLAVLVYKYIPDFDPARGMISKSSEPHNPRIVFVVYKGRQQIDARAAEIGKAETIAGGLAEVTFPQYKPYTGLSIRRDPGVNIVWFGCAWLLIGLALSFYIFHRQVRAVVEAREGGSRLHVGGTAAKNKIAFADEFQRLIEPYCHTDRKGMEA